MSSSTAEKSARLQEVYAQLRTYYMLVAPLEAEASRLRQELEELRNPPKPKPKRHHGYKRSEPDDIRKMLRNLSGEQLSQLLKVITKN